VIFAFLRNWQATLITALVIPLSLLATFIVMAVAGFNLETITCWPWPWSSASSSMTPSSR
jgi:multidrug efflux pump subunit AcrB